MDIGFNLFDKVLIQPDNVLILMDNESTLFAKPNIQRNSCLSLLDIGLSLFDGVLILRVKLPSYGISISSCGMTSPSRLLIGLSFRMEDLASSIETLSYWLNSHPTGYVYIIAWDNLAIANANWIILRDGRLIQAGKMADAAYRIDS